MNNFDNKTILVTGASGGIGGATVRKLLARGAKVIAAGRDKSDLAAREQPGAQPLAFDLTSEESISSAIAGLDLWGVVNCQEMQAPAPTAPHPEHAISSTTSHLTPPAYAIPIYRGYPHPVSRGFRSTIT